MTHLKNLFFTTFLALLVLATGLSHSQSAAAEAHSSQAAAPVLTEVSSAGPNQANLHPNAVAKPEHLHRAANRSYSVRGVRYTPLTRVAEFTETGRASWYGTQFHGRLTSSGERYDMNLMTAAHRTLPIPSYARVTNLNNGKSIVVRINDRGPFHNNRIIDVSYAAAQRLGFTRSGVTNVRVEQIIPDANLRSALPQRDSGKIYVNLREFANRGEAQRYLEQTARHLRHLNNTTQNVLLVPQGGQYIVRLGPFLQQEQAEQLKQTVLTQL